MDLIIDEISSAAYEAIEQAAAEAARAAFLEGVEREAELMRDVQYWQVKAQELNRSNLKNGVIAGVIGFLGGLVLGIVINK